MTENSNSDRRRSERLITVNFVSYTDKDDKGQIVAEGMAKTLDISLNGAMLELQSPLVNPKVAELELALDDEVLALPGLVIDQKKTADNCYRLRVEFKDLKPAVLHKLQTYILSFR